MIDKNLTGFQRAEASLLHFLLLLTFRRIRKEAKEKEKQEKKRVHGPGRYIYDSYTCHCLANLQRYVQVSICLLYPDEINDNFFPLVNYCVYSAIVQPQTAVVSNGIQAKVEEVK